MKRSCRELSIGMVIYTGIFKNNQITLFPVLPINLKRGLLFNVLVT